MWVHNVRYYCLSTVANILVCQNFRKLCIISYIEVILPKVTYFHTQFKSHNIQILNNKRLIIHWQKKFINNM
jgi:hypothetical protein